MGDVWASLLIIGVEGLTLNLSFLLHEAEWIYGASQQVLSGKVR